ncbi:MAG: ABC transporter ATP-binding protein [Nitrospirae bacterium]|nr:ABC transporter ATP-binding protein [Nitrospirota bacterium]MDE3041921.1 ABC transporter ATP-binding protein [Nitrospirota bacterium]
MSQIAIRVNHLSKQYHIQSANNRHDRLGDKLLHGLRSLWGGDERSKAGRRSFWALKDFSFEIKQGEVIGLIGGNGAGKSTLLKILSRITEPTEGRAEVYGRISSLLEVGTGFVGDLSGRDNVYLSGAILGMRKSEIDRRFDEIVEFSGVEAFIDEPVKHYSSGMYVRLGFSVAAHLEPDILVVDEVLAVGDAAFQQKCLGKMGDVAKVGRTVLFVSHNMAAMQGLCSKCYLLKGGQLVAQGAPRTVIEEYLAKAASGEVIQLGQRKDRQGTGEIRFEEVTIGDAKGRPIDNALCGQDISIAVSYRSRDDKPISRLDVHITFHTSLGQFMFTCSSEASGLPLDVLPPKGRMICHIPELPLAPGRYVFNLYSTVGGVIADWVTQVGSLNVVPGDFFGTGQLKTHAEGFLVKNKWTVSSRC